MVQLPPDWIGVKIRSRPSDVRQGYAVKIVNRTKSSDQATGDHEVPLFRNSFGCCQRLYDLP